MGEAPQQYQQFPQFANMHQMLSSYVRAMQADVTRGSFNLDLARQVLNHCSEDLDKLFALETSRAKYTSEQAWRAWVQEQSMGSAGWCHKKSRFQVLWKPSAVLHNGQWTGRPSALLRAEADRLSRACQAQEEAPDRWHLRAEHSRQQLPRVTVDEFRAVLRSFPKRTAQTFDGFHPRHFDLLSD